MINLRMAGIMQTQENQTKYPLSMKLYHWVAALMVGALIYVGYNMSDMPASDEKWRMYFMHKSFGLLFLIVMLSRLYNRFRSKIPPLPEKISIFDAKMSHIVHYLLYGVLIIMPISGIFMSIFAGKGMPFFFTTFFSDIAKHEEINGAAWIVHTKLPTIILLLIGLHLVGSMKHFIVDKVNLLKRMI
jgi:cytochrome b561